MSCPLLHPSTPPANTGIDQKTFEQRYAKKTAGALAQVMGVSATDVTLAGPTPPKQPAPAPRTETAANVEILKENKKKPAPPKPVAPKPNVTKEANITAEPAPELPAEQPPAEEPVAAPAAAEEAPAAPPAEPEPEPEPVKAKTKEGEL